jgi:hypothetical protein
MGLLRWANRLYREETPELQHAVSEFDASGAPAMRPAPAAYLALLRRDLYDRDGRPKPDEDRADNWRSTACRLDRDGAYVTPLRCAIERVPDPDRRRLLRYVVPEAYRPGDVATVLGIPSWCAGDVLYRSLVMLRQAYRLVPEAQVGWVSKSDAQRQAESAAA